jgi:hypothetical protein
MKQRPPELSKQEFCERFVDRMVRACPSVGPGGRPIRVYAEAVAPVYWAEVHLDGISPEDCADDDMAYWRKET